MSYTEWQQGFQRLISLIEKYVGDDHKLWKEHYDCVNQNYTRDEKWGLWLSYDIEVRRQTISNHIDISQFHPSIYDSCRLAYEERSMIAHIHTAIAASIGANRTQSSQNRTQPYNSRATTGRQEEGQVSRNLRRCLVCGSTRHPPRVCIATELLNGQPLVLRIVPGTGRGGNSPKRVDEHGHAYCFPFNGTSGCSKPLNGSGKCDHGRHGCTFCKSTSHGAQSCGAVHFPAE